MDKYYWKTDVSKMYHIAMGMLLSSRCISPLNKGIHLESAPPSTQAQVLSTAWMGEGLDLNSCRNHQG
jgi:hypothetical protein